MDGLVSAQLKFARATKHVDALKKRISTYIRSKPHKVIRHPKGKKEPQIRRLPPPDIAVLSGEVLYQLRSALDHLIFELVKRNPTGVTLPPRWEEASEFPIKFRLPDKVAAPPVPLPLFAKWTKLPGLTRDAYAFIEPLQPYNFPPPRFGPLGILSLLSNIDKHRYLHVTVPRAEHSQRIISAEGWEHETRGRVDWGASVELLADKSKGDVQLESSFATYVTFNEPTLGERNRVPIEILIEGLLKFCKDIGTAFEKFLS